MLFDGNSVDDSLFNWIVVKLEWLKWHYENEIFKLGSTRSLLCSVGQHLYMMNARI